MEQRELPEFRYHKHPLKNRSIVKKRATCSVCGKETEYVYNGPVNFYADGKCRKDICPWCVADGSAAAALDCYFTSPYDVESSVNDGAMEELIYRTPGYCAWQEINWLTHCYSPCAFVGYCHTEDLREHGIDVERDIQREADLRGFSRAMIYGMLERDHIYQGYLFQCPVCGTYRITIDSD